MHVRVAFERAAASLQALGVSIVQCDARMHVQQPVSPALTSMVSTIQADVATVPLMMQRLGPLRVVIVERIALGDRFARRASL